MPTVVPYPPPRLTGNKDDDIISLGQWIWTFYQQTIVNGYVPPSTEVSTESVTVTAPDTGSGVPDEILNMFFSALYGGVLRISNTLAGTYVDLFCLDDGTLAILDENGNGYVRLYNGTFDGRVSLRCDTDGAFSVVSDDENELFQVYQDGTVQGQGPLEKTVADTTYTLLAADRGKLLNFTSASAVTVTVPLDFLTGDLASSVFYWRQAGAGQLTFAAAGGVTIRNADSHTKSYGQYAMGMLHQMADVNTWNLVGRTGA